MKTFRIRQLLMNSPIASPANSTTQTFQAIVEALANGQVAAWVTEFQDAKVIAADRTTAIVELEKVLKKRLESVERVVIEVDLDDRNIDLLPSIPSDDQYFRELMATLRADRELDDDNPAYRSQMSSIR
jgi:predicted house-cleaning NTP pyrophosphatase (Maf/HAM1 superfamily)